MASQDGNQQTASHYDLRAQEEIAMMKEGYQKALDFIAYVMSKTPVDQRGDLQLMRDFVVDSRHETLLMATYTEELVEIVKRMEAQKQTNYDSYVNGYKAALLDALAEVSGPEAAKVRELLQQKFNDSSLPY